MVGSRKESFKNNGQMAKNNKIWIIWKCILITYAAYVERLTLQPHLSLFIIIISMEKMKLRQSQALSGNKCCLIIYIGNDEDLALRLTRLAQKDPVSRKGAA